MGQFLIIGGSSGIGRQLALQLSESGHEVIATYNRNRVDSGEAGGIDYHNFDVLEERSELDFIPDRLDGMVYCPGAINLKPFHRFTPESFIEDFRLQAAGAVKTIQAAMPALEASDTASIVLFSTVAVQTGYNYHTLVSSSKGALEGLTRALAAELAPDIRVNCVAPSLTDTPLAASLLNSDKKREANAERHPLKRLGTPRDIAGMAEFLLGPSSGWITGQVLSVDGGISTVNAS